MAKSQTMKAKSLKKTFLKIIRRTSIPTPVEILSEINRGNQRSIVRVLAAEVSLVRTIKEARSDKAKQVVEIIIEMVGMGNQIGIVNHHVLHRIIEVIPPSKSLSLFYILH
jgi:DNA-directed RNA polymerase subunit F